jgi:glutaconate CoA-transferase, subunit A
LKSADFVAARRHIEAKPLSAVEKLTTLSEAARYVKDSDHIAIGGCMSTRTPLALLMEILRQRRTGLTLSRNLTCYEGEWFLAAGAAQTVITSWLGVGLPWGISKIMRQFAETGEARIEDWSHMAMGLRYRAGAMGIPFLPTLTMLGSDLMRVTEAKTMICPFTGETLCLVPALFPDVAVIHVHRADRMGNSQIDGYPFMDADLAKAAATVLITAEEIVPEADIKRQSERTVIPGFIVDAVVEVPYGAYPHECHGLYETDFEHFDTYVQGIHEHGLAGVTDYLERYVYGVRTHGEYLDLFGAESIARQVQRARELVGKA